jgi:alpha-beta hydrolase superfamily lysophospholipase
MNLRITLTLLFPALYLNPGLAFSLKSLSRKQQLSSLAATIAPDSGIPNIESQFLDFKGHTYYSEVARSKASPPFPNTKPEVILIHGFGCSSFYWRETKRYLTSAGYTVHALDLLGQGKSEKPGRAQGVVYSTDLWAQQIDSYAHKNVRNDNGIILMGNSLGGPVALAAATGDFNPLQGTTPYIASTIKVSPLHISGFRKKRQAYYQRPQLLCHFC